MCVWRSAVWQTAKAASRTEKLSGLINIDGVSVCIGKASASRLFILTGNVAISYSVMEVQGWSLLVSSEVPLL